MTGPAEQLGVVAGQQVWAERSPGRWVHATVVSVSPNGEWVIVTYGDRGGKRHLRPAQIRTEAVS